MSTETLFTILNVCKATAYPGIERNMEGQEFRMNEWCASGRNLERVNTIEKIFGREFLDDTNSDIRSLSNSAIQIVAALACIGVHPQPWLMDYLMAELHKRADLSQVSPAAEAVMRIFAFSRYGSKSAAEEEIAAQAALLRALSMEPMIHEATAFFDRLAARLKAIVATPNLP